MDIMKTKMKIGKMGKMFVWARPDHEPTPEEKIIREKIDKDITNKSELRDIKCWSAGCARYPHKWVREIQFDVYKDGERINKAGVTSDDYTGPVPGFCFAHTTQGPSDLAKVVYFDRPEIHWGFRPLRYVIIFTDGTKEIGDVVSIIPNEPDSIVTDKHIRGLTNG